MAIDIEAIPTTYQEAVRLLAHWHGDYAARDLVIFSFPDHDAVTVRLLEVSSELPDTGELVPVTFGRSPEFPFRSTVVLATPCQWKKIQAGELALPDGWDLAARQRVWPDAGA